MKSDLLESARRIRDAVLKDHQQIVHKAASAVRASKTKYEAAQKQVRDLELAVITAEAAIAADMRRARRETGAAG